MPIATSHKVVIRVAGVERGVAVQVPVLIVGGGPIGLTASALLSQHGVENLLINDRPTTSTHPRARFLDVRTLEILRQMGLADLVTATGLPPEWLQSVRYSTTFAEPEVYRLPTESYHSIPRATSPVMPVMTSQDLIEPIMFEAARSFRSADVRFGARLISLQQTESGCHARFEEDGGAGDVVDVEAQWVIGADGRNSSVRSLLGGELDVGFSNAAVVQDVLYDADMSPWVGDRRGALLFVYHPMGYGLFQPLDGDRRWRAQCTTFTPPIAPEDITEADCIAWIRSAIGDHDAQCDINVQSIAPWTPEARLSDDFRRGRVFLAGDAAHTLYPTGGLGMNLGYHGVHNLAWKLASVIHGQSSADILSTYEIERRPQAERTRIASVDNARLAGELYRAHLTGADVDQAGHRLRQYGNFEGLILSPEYESSLCAAEAEPPPAVDNELVDFVPSVRAGRRAPHVWIDDGRSILDVFGSEYVWLAAESRADEAREFIDEDGPPTSVVALPGRAFENGLYDADEAVLVRPDGVIASRATLRASC